MRKSYLLLIITVFVMIFSGCKNEPPPPPQQQNLLVGKWKTVAIGISEDNLSYIFDKEDEYTEFKSDGTIWSYDIESLSPYIKTGKYKIDEEYFYHYSINGQNEEIYTYSFDGDRFKISNINPTDIGFDLFEIANVVIFERIQ